MLDSGNMAMAPSTGTFIRNPCSNLALYCDLTNMGLKVCSVDPGCGDHVICVNNGELLWVTMHGKGLGYV